MDKLTVQLKNYATLQLVECPEDLLIELSEQFTFEVPGAKFMPAVRKRRWDGKIRLLNRQTREISAGLYFKIKEYAERTNRKIECIETKYGRPDDTNRIDYDEFNAWLKSLPLNLEIRDYQYLAITHAAKNKRAVMISPTGSGKSFIIYLTILWYLMHKNINQKILIVVPTTSLVEQFHKDLESYGLDVNKFCQKIYSGHEKIKSKRIVISTWQSIYKLPSKWFTSFGMVIGDECHQFKAKSLSSIMNKAFNAEYRLGYTGTLDGTQVNALMLEGLFGPIRRVARTVDLQEKGYLAPLNIDVIQLNHPAEHCRDLHGATYHEEVDFLISNEKRNHFIANLCESLEGNTLVLFNYVEKHGHVLRDILKKKLDDDRKLFFISGATDVKDREAIRPIVEKQKSGKELQFGDKSIFVHTYEKVPLANGNAKFGKDITTEDDIDDDWLRDKFI